MFQTTGKPADLSVKIFIRVCLSFSLDGTGGLQFSFRGCRSANKLVIRLNGLDLYDMTFWKVNRSGECVQVSESCNMYADQLQDVFIADTGLDLRIA